jgi:hypothetical protein
LQLTQAPPQATLQQTPSAQKPEAHSLAFVQTAPCGFGPQLPSTHLTPGTQSASERQSGKHCPPAVSQLKGAQMVCGPAWQRPAPSQTSSPVTAAPSQVPGWHTIPAGYCRQLPCPSQVPSSPQVATSDLGHVAVEGGALPAGTKLQTPGAPGLLHALHVSAQAVSQQTPSTQKPLAQSPAHPQAWPLGLFGLSALLHETSVPASRRPGWASGLLPPPAVLPQPAARKPRLNETRIAARAQARAPGGGRQEKLIASGNVESQPSDHKCKVATTGAVSSSERVRRSRALPVAHRAPIAAGCRC